MTVCELIDKLWTLPSDALVKTSDGLNIFIDDAHIDSGRVHITDEGPSEGN